MSIDLVVTDLDGTLWDTNGQMRHSTREALRRLENLGIPVLAATARGGGSTALVFDELGISLPVVHCNGAFGKESNGTSFYQSPFSKELVRWVLSAFESENLVPHMSVDCAEYTGIALGTMSSCAEVSKRNQPFTRIVDAEAALTHDIYDARILGIDKQRLQAVHAALDAHPAVRSRFAADALVGRWSLIASPIGATKWAGVEAFCDAHGIDQNSVLGIGDGANDIELLERCAVSIAMPTQFQN